MSLLLGLYRLADEPVEDASEDAFIILWSIIRLGFLLEAIT